MGRHRKLGLGGRSVLSVSLLSFILSLHRDDKVRGFPEEYRDPRFRFQEGDRKSTGCLGGEAGRLL